MYSKFENYQTFKVLFLLWIEPLLKLLSYELEF